MKVILSFLILGAIACKGEKVIETQRIIQEIEVPVDRPPDPSGPLPNDPPGYVSVERMTEAMNNYVQSFSNSIQEDIAFVNGCNYYNAAPENQKDDVLAKIEAGANKVLNYLSTERNIHLVQDLGPAAPCAFAYNERKIGMTRLEYWSIENELLFDLAPRGDRETLLRFLTQKRRPWIHLNEFAIVTMQSDRLTENNHLYYELTGQNFNDYNSYLLSKGVDLDESVELRELAMAGISSSPIALGKTRGIYSVPSDDGYCVFTMDTDKATEDNIIENFAIPEILRIDGDIRIDDDKLFNSDAFEVICTKRNGIFGDFMLRAVDNFAVGFPETVAPATIVNNVDFSHIDPQIRIGADCGNCHNAGIIEFTDEVHDSIINNPLIEGDTKKAVDIFYNVLRMSGHFQDINRTHQEKMVQMGIDKNTDPLTNTIVFPLRSEMSVEFVSAMFQIKTVDEFLVKLAAAGESRTILANLLTPGGRVSLATLIKSYPIVVDEMNLFKDREDF